MKKIYIITLFTLFSAIFGFNTLSVYAATTPVWQDADKQVESQTSTTEVVVTKPLNVASGDLIIFVINHGNTCAMGAVTPPTDVQLIRDETADNSSAFRPRTLTYYKIAGGSEPATYSFTRAGTTSCTVRSVTGRVTGYRTVSSTPIDQQNGTNSVGSTVSSIAIPSITSSESNTLLITTIGLFTQVTASSIVHPSGSDSRWSQTAAPPNGGSTETLTASGVTGTRTWSWTTASRATGVMFNIFGAEDVVSENPFRAVIKLRDSIIKIVGGRIKIK